MFKSTLAMAAIAAALSFTAVPALAQTGSSCAAAAARASDNIAMRVQQNTPGAENRESARLHVGMASQAAAAGNEAESREEPNVASLFVGLPSGSTPQSTGVA